MAPSSGPVGPGACYESAVPRIGLALGAGGVAGHAFHAGVLAALEEATGWDAREADVVVGTSAGSVVGALLRAGVTPGDIAAGSTGEALSPEGEALRLRAGPRPGIPSRPPPRTGRFPAMAAPGLFVRAALRPFRPTRPGVLAAAALPAGRVPTELVASALRGLFDARWPERALWVVAVRLDQGRRVVFGREGAPPVEVPDAVAASCAIPGFFEPVVVEGVRYVDGGAHSLTNADLLARRGLDLVVVSSPMSVAGSGLRLGRLDAPARRLARLALAREVGRIRRNGTPVLVLQPTADVLGAMGMNAMDPSQRADVTRAARASALRKLERADVEPMRSVLASASASVA